MRVWVVIFEHKHGVDSWPTTKEPTVEGVKEELRREGSWTEEDDDQDRIQRSHIEIRGPWDLEGEDTCPHGMAIADCNACAVASDLAFDADREDRFR
jgi:hypothetical protein